MRWAGTCCISLIAIACCSVAAAAERMPELSRWTIDDPPLNVPEPVRVLPESWQVLWSDALTGPEQDLRREAAEAILLEHERGNVDVSKLTDALIQGFRSSTIPTVRLSLAATLIAMDVSSAAADLHSFAAEGNRRVILRIEPALAEWKYQPMLSVWFKRIEQPQFYSGVELLLAIQGLVAAEEHDAVPHLLRLAASHLAQPRVRLAAAGGIAALQTEGLIERCRPQLESPSDKHLIDRQIAVRMLAGHASREALQLMLLATEDRHSSVSVVALRRLVELRADMLTPQLPDLQQKSDPVIRRLAVQASALQPSVESAVRLAGLLNDPHPAVRNDARYALEEFVTDHDLMSAVTEHVEKHLFLDDWRGIEQAARLLGTLDYEPVADQLVKLLDHERAEVRITSAWALREIGVSNTLKPMYDFAQQLSDPPQDSTKTADRAARRLVDDVCLGHLFEAFGRAGYRPASPLLLRFLPKSFDKGELSRSAAIWALGMIHESDASDESLARKLVSRATDADILRPEYPEVRTAAAVSLGRMRSVESVEALRAALSQPIDARTVEGIKWAIGQLTGTPLPATKPQRVAPPQPFLRALD